jgi:hypothetical protein
VHLAIVMRERIAELSIGWRKYGHELGFGVGIAHGYATLSRIGFEGRFDYSTIRRWARDSITISCIIPFLHQSDLTM